MRKAVNKTNIKPKPSSPKIIFMLIEFNQLFLYINWKSETVWSKKKSNKKQRFNIINDQNNEKRCMILCWVLSINDKTKQPIKGDKISANNIRYKI